MAEFRKGKPCDICGRKKKPQAKHCLECSNILTHLTAMKGFDNKIKEVRRILKERNIPIIIQEIQ